MNRALRGVQFWAVLLLAAGVLSLAIASLRLLAETK